MKKILLIGNVTEYAPLRLKVEAELRGHLFDQITPSQIQFEDQKISVEGGSLSQDFLDYDVYFFRGIGKSEARMQVVASYLGSLGKRVVEKILVDKLLPEDKFVPESASGKYKIPKYFVINRGDNKEVTIEQFPVVAKKLKSSMGKGVSLINTYEELETFKLGYDGPIIIQEYHQIDYDVRVLVVGDTVLGSFARYKVNQEDFLTTRKGGQRNSFEINDEIASAVIEVKKLHGLEIAGVDLFFRDETPYIIEVNASPQFKIFEQTQGINVAGKIIDYLAE